MKLIYTTCKNEVEAKKVALALLNKKLIACANYFPIKSIYRWKGNIQNDKEVILLVKTTKPFHKIKDEMEKLHSYEIPCIAELPVRNMNTKYHTWLLEQMQ
jgi:periplasmic divalent cation tolerance protein